MTDNCCVGIIYQRIISSNCLSSYHVDCLLNFVHVKLHITNSHREFSSFNGLIIRMDNVPVFDCIRIQTYKVLL